MRLEKCCRSTPRCAGCPVLGVAARQPRPGMPACDPAAMLIAGVLAPGRRKLPADVVRALADLDRARTRIAA